MRPDGGRPPGLAGTALVVHPGASPSPRRPIATPTARRGERPRPQRAPVAVPALRYAPCPERCRRGAASDAEARYAVDRGRHPARGVGSCSGTGARAVPPRRACRSRSSTPATRWARVSSGTAPSACPRYLMSGGVGKSWEWLTEVKPPVSWKYDAVGKPLWSIAEGRTRLEDLGDGRTRIHFSETYHAFNPVHAGPARAPGPPLHLQGQRPPDHDGDQRRHPRTRAASSTPGRSAGPTSRAGQRAVPDARDRDRTEPFGGPPPLVGVEQLVRAARRGDAAAMDALVRELMPYVSRVCGAIALDRGDDAMQETFIAVLRNLRSLREPAALYGWVRRIAVREAHPGRPRRRPRTRRPGDLTAGWPRRSISTWRRRRRPVHPGAPRSRATGRPRLRDVDGLSEAETAGAPRRRRGHREVAAPPGPCPLRPEVGTVSDQRRRGPRRRSARSARARALARLDPERGVGRRVLDAPYDDDVALGCRPGGVGAALRHPGAASCRCCAWCRAASGRRRAAADQGVDLRRGPSPSTSASRTASASCRPGPVLPRRHGGRAPRRTAAHALLPPRGDPAAGHVRPRGVLAREVRADLRRR